MPTPDDIRAAFTLRGLNVVRYSEDVRRRATGLLESLAGRIHRYLLTADLGTRRRREKAIKLITRMSVEHYDSVEDILESSMVALARDESRHFKAVFGRGSGKQLLKREAVSIINTLLIDGVPLKDWLIGQSMELAQRVGRQIRLSPAQATGYDLSAAIFGRPAGRSVLALDHLGKIISTPVFQGGQVLQTARRHLNTMSKSAVHAASQASALESFKRASSVTKLELSVILDNRTSPICNSRAGAVWFAGSGQPAPESAVNEPFPGPPPYHLNCRSMLIPYVDEVAPEVAFKEWISSLKPAQQRDILGAAGYNEYKAGRLDLGKVRDVGARPLTIEQLRDSY